MKKAFTTAEYVTGLRALADFYESHPDMPLPYAVNHVYSYEREEFLKGVKILADGGKVSKTTQGDDSNYPTYHATRAFGPVTLDVQIDRKTICRMVRPAQPAVFECPDSLLEEGREFEDPRDEDERIFDAASARSPQFPEDL